MRCVAMLVAVAIVATTNQVAAGGSDGDAPHAGAGDAPHGALSDVLGEATTIVRGSASDSTRTGATIDTRVMVLETLRGTVDGDSIVVRQPADGEEPLGRGEDVMLLLDARTADGAYPLHHPAGRYRVESGSDGDVVIVNANGIDGTAVSAKDLRPRAPDERIAIATFRSAAGAAPNGPSNGPSNAPSTTAPRATDPALSAPTISPHPRGDDPEASRAGTERMSGTADEPRHARWPWVLLGASLGLAVVVFTRRRRR